MRQALLLKQMVIGLASFSLASTHSLSTFVFLSLMSPSSKFVNECLLYMTTKYFSCYCCAVPTRTEALGAAASDRGTNGQMKLAIQC